MKKMWKRAVVFLVGLAMGMSLVQLAAEEGKQNAVHAEELHAVIFNGLTHDTSKNLEFSLNKEFGIIEHYYWPAGDTAIEWVAQNSKLTVEQWKAKYQATYVPLDDSFVESLAKSKLLLIGANTSDYGMFLFNERPYADAVTDFLRNGGTLIFEYCAAAPLINPFLKSIGVTNPWSNPKEKDGAYKLNSCVAVVSGDDNKHPILNNPNKAGGEIEAYSWYTSWPQEQQVLFANAASPKNTATMLVQKQVLGKGTVIFNSLYPCFRNRPAGEAGRLLENILTYVYGRNIKEYKQKKLKEEGGPGESVNQ